ncbi:MAG: hypothetical protein DMG61_19410 [Acidobacteria bacterium]|nr:MAG: hypothetical protein DMG61_19410 [Acidobacteriota bacterium]
MTRSFRPKVVVADDHPGALHAVRKLLAEGFHVVAAVPNGELALHAVAQFDPDLVILDICMPRLDGLLTARELKAKGFKGPIVFLTVQEDEDYIFAAQALGALGYVLKSRMRTDLLSAIDEALAGRAFISSISSQSALQWMRKAAD